MDKSWRVVFCFVGIFIAGAVSGLLLAPRVFTNVAERRAQQGPGRGPGGPNGPAQQVGVQLFRRLSERLNLTAEQREKIKPIELRTTEALRRLRNETQYNTQVALDGMQDEISAILTPEQRVRFEEQIAKSRAAIKKFLQEQEGRGRREPGAPNRPRDTAPSK